MMNDLQRLMAAAEKDPALSERLSALEAEALVEWAAAKGYSLTLDEAQSFSATYEELSDDDLEQVAGGWTGDNTPPGP